MLKTVVVGLALGILLPITVHAASTQSILNKACTYGVSFAGCSSGDQGLDTTGSGKTTFLQTIVDTFLYAGGIVSMFFVVMGGFRYITSTGDPSRIKSAKDTLLYAIIGLIVTFLAIPISGYVIKTLGG